LTEFRKGVNPESRRSEIYRHQSLLMMTLRLWW